MNIFVTWIRNGNPVMTILDFIELPKSHTGRNMAQALVNTLERYGIAHKVSTCGIQEDSMLTEDLDGFNYS